MWSLLTILDVEVWDNNFYLFYTPFNVSLMLYHTFNICGLNFMNILILKDPANFNTLYHSDKLGGSYLIPLSLYINFLFSNILIQRHTYTVDCWLVIVHDIYLKKEE